MRVSHWRQSLGTKSVFCAEQSDDREGWTPESAKDLTDMASTLDQRDAMLRDYDMQLDKDDITDKVRRAEFYAAAAEALVQDRWKKRPRHL